MRHDVALADLASTKAGLLPLVQREANHFVSKDSVTLVAAAETATTAKTANLASTPNALTLGVAL